MKSRCQQRRRGTVAVKVSAQRDMKMSADVVARLPGYALRRRWFRQAHRAAHSGSCAQTHAQASVFARLHSQSEMYDSEGAHFTFFRLQAACATVAAARQRATRLWSEFTSPFRPVLHAGSDSATQPQQRYVFPPSRAPRPRPPSSKPRRSLLLFQDRRGYRDTVLLPHFKGERVSYRYCAAREEAAIALCATRKKTC